VSGPPLFGLRVAVGGEGSRPGGAGGSAVLRPTDRLVWHNVVLACRTGSVRWVPGRGRTRGSRRPRAAMTDRAERWATVQVGRLGRTMAEVVRELGGDWRTVNSAVIAYGTVLVDDPERFRGGRDARAGRDAVLPAGPLGTPGVRHLDRGRDPRRPA
jgi:hypothetical protein